MIRRPQVQVLVVALAVLAVLALLIWALSSRDGTRQAFVLSSSSPEPTRATVQQEIKAPATAPIQTPREEASPALAQSGPETAVPLPSVERSALSQAAPGGPQGALMIPVAGDGPEQLQDTYSQSRSEGRVHNAIDIMAPKGTPVVAAADGTIHKIFYSERGGNTIYQLDGDGKTVYYYAHLDSYAPAIAQGRFVRRGEVIGYVGDTGNAGAGNYHLHFSVSITTDLKQIHDGTPVNPYPLLVPHVR